MDTQKTTATTEPEKRLWLIQYCSVTGCQTPIRVPLDSPLTTPICKWCDRAVSRATNPKTWPDGMPDPELPWPWMTEADREHKLRTPYWKDRLRQHAEQYAKWMRT